MFAENHRRKWLIKSVKFFLKRSARYPVSETRRSINTLTKTQTGGQLLTQKGLTQADLESYVAGNAPSKIRKAVGDVLSDGYRWRAGDRLGRLIAFNYPALGI